MEETSIMYGCALISLIILAENAIFNWKFWTTIYTELTELNLKFSEKVLGLLSISVTLVYQTKDLHLSKLLRSAAWLKSTTHHILLNKN
jgi:hypothetical protein